ncbi:HNH endonuclease [Candidatus Woesearchaeota archaeon]|nr:MAG: HNH endonuclease [Candidatus Woesearchaeota archaeon]
MHAFVRNHTWMFVREDVLRRDNWRCCICQKRKGRAGLDIDHIIPVRSGIDPYDKNNLRTLCKDCHKAKTKLELGSF